MLRSRTVEVIRSRAEKPMTDSALIEVQDDSVGGFGQETNTWSTVAADVSCRIIRSTTGTKGAEMVAGRESMVDNYRLVCPHDTALAINQRVTVNDITYHVVEVLTALTDNVDAQAIIKRAR